MAPKDKNDADAIGVGRVAVGSPNIQGSWPRYWITRGSDWPNDEGFLLDPESDMPWGVTDRPVELSALDNIHALVLLGEAGSGKSTAVMEAFESARARHACSFHDLGEYGDETRLVQDVFNSQLFQTYLNGSSPFYLFLDSFDECALGIPHLSRLLALQLKKRVLDPSRFYLRIACRSADWPKSLEDSLREKWESKDNTQQVGVFELCPLREVDVRQKAESAGMDGKKFVKAIHQRDVQSLACHPKTLNYLLSEYVRRGDLPDRRADLFQHGILFLCEEQQPRIEAGKGGALDAQTRMDIASHIAAALVFGNRSAIWKGDALEKHPEDTSLEDLVSREMSGNLSNMHINLLGLRETMTVAGLFRHLGPQRIRFAHRSDAEFLAALYLIRRKTPADQILMILQHPVDQHVVPQLYQTASWLASMHRDIFSYILKTEPKILLSGDIAGLDYKRKEQIVDNLLRVYQSGIEYEWIDRSKLRRLWHPSLPTQIKTFLTKRNNSLRARILAIDIATACEASGAQKAIIAVALDEREHYLLRSEAAESIAEIGDPLTKVRLRPLVLTENESDEDDRLKAASLKALWPDNLSPGDLFSALTPQNNKHYIGSYSRFIRHDLPSTLRAEHLPFALDWVEKQPSRWHADLVFQDLTDDIMDLAWDHLDEPGVLPAFCKAVLSLLRNHDGIFNRHGRTDNKDHLSDDTKRRKLLRGLISIANRKTIRLVGWFVAREQDALWLLSKCRQEPLVSKRLIIAELISQVVRIQTDPRVIGEIVDSAGCHASSPDLVLRRVLRQLLLPIRLKSKRAKELKASWHREQKWAKRKQLKRARHDRAANIEKQLTLLEQGNLNAWIGTLNFSTLDEENGIYHFPSSGLSKTPGWEHADHLTRARILKGALHYIQGAQPLMDGYLDGSQPQKLGDAAAYVALQLLAEESAFHLDSAHGSLFDKWADVITVNPNLQSGPSDDYLLTQLAECCERKFLTSLKRLINREGPDPKGFWRTERFSHVWTDKLGHVVFETAKQRTLSESTRTNLFAFLLRHRYLPCQQYLHRSAIEDSSADQTMALRLLAEVAPIENWDLLADFRRNSEERAKDLFLYVADVYESNIGPYALLSETELADLYIWLNKQFPPSKDPKIEGVYTPTPRHRIADFRSALLAHLRERGTDRACSALENIVDSLPDQDWLRRTLQEAKRKTRMVTWQAPHLREIFLLSQNPEARLVRSEAELRDAILASLTQLQMDLRGETPLTPFLWDERTRKPKNENRLSDFLKFYLVKILNQKGVIVNREIEVHNWKGRGRGDSTDLMVQTTASQGELLTVVVETKGCWHSDVTTGMENQLRKKYLVTANHQTGIYLVVWFGTNQCRGRELSMLRRLLDDQGMRLSRGGITIRAMVLDCSFPAKSSRKATKSSSAPARSRRKLKKC